jgi:putative pyoverdin transport system ATP-binding/permease protein
MELLNFFFKKEPKKSLHILILSVLAGMSEVASVLLTINGVQDVAAGKNYMLYAIFLPTAAITFILSKRISQTRTATLSEDVLKNLYTDIANDIRHAELPEIEARDTTGIYLKMLNAQTFTDAAVKGVHTFQSLLAIFFLWLYVFRISPMGGWVSLVIFSVAAGVYSLMRKEAIPLMREESEKEKELASLFDHILYGAREIRISRQKNDDLFENHLVPIISQVKKTRAQMLSYFSRYWTFTSACFFIALAGVAFIFPVYYSHGTAISMLIIGIYVWTPMLMVVSALQGITEGEVAMDELRRLAGEEKIARKSGRRMDDASEDPTVKFKELALDHVEFVYESSEGESGFRTGPVSFTGRAGEIILVAGGNGSGKTTLMKILTGLYPQTSGEIRINADPVKMSRHRHMFSTVFSDFHLFDAIYGLNEIDGDTVDELLMKTELSHKTRWIPDEKRFSAIHLSAGQKKRLALVISLLEDKPVYVFDEWAADQDPHFRKYFYETLLPSMRDKGKLIIAVSHDDRYFHIADRLIRMEYGQMISCAAPGDDFPKPKKIVEKTLPERYANLHEQEEYLNESRKFSSKSKHDKKKAKKKRNRFTELLRPSAKDGLKGLIFSGILSVICGPIIVGAFFTAANLPHEASRTRLFLLFLITLVLFLISYQRFCDSLVYIIEDRIARARLKALEQIRHTDLYSFEKTGIEKIRAALTYDMKSVSEASNAVAFSSRAVFTFTGFLFFMATLSMTAFLMTLAVSAVAGSIFAYNQVMIRRIVYQVREGEKRLFDAVKDILKGFKELRLNSQKNSDFFHNCFRVRSFRLRRLKLRAAKRFIDIYTLACGFWQMLFILAALILPFAGFFSGNTLMTFVGVMVCLPIGAFADHFPRVTLSTISMQRLYELGEELENLEEESMSEKDDHIEFMEIRYESISFQYKENSERPFSVGPLSMTFRPGEIVFIVGGNGSGKSTLLNMLTGLYPLDSGQAFLNNGETEIIRFRSIFSVIFHNFHLFDQLYGLKNIDEQKVNDLLRLMGLDDKVKFAGNKFSSLDLSAGQKKRIAMAAAIMEDKPIYVFDEWAADQDPQFRRYFYETLLPSFKAQGKTVIAASHDDRYFHVADRVIRLEYGKLAE